MSWQLSDIIIWLTSFLYLASSFLDPPALDMKRLMVLVGWYLVNTLITTGGPRVSTVKVRLHWRLPLQTPGWHEAPVCHTSTSTSTSTIITISPSPASQQLETSLAEVGQRRKSRACPGMGDIWGRWEPANDMKTDIIVKRTTPTQTVQYYPVYYHITPQWTHWTLNNNITPPLSSFSHKNKPRKLPVFIFRLWLLHITFYFIWLGWFDIQIMFLKKTDRVYFLGSVL